MPRRNNRDRRYEPKEYDEKSYSTDTSRKPTRRRKLKNDKKLYRSEDQ